MKFITIALIAAVAADTTSLELNGAKTNDKAATVAPKDVKTSKDEKKKEGPTTVKWEKTKNGVKKNYNATYDKENKTMVSEMRKTWENYFEYAFKSKGIKEGDVDGTDLPSCSSAQECGDSGKKQVCCVNTVLHHKASGTKDINYKCMTKAVVDANVDMTLGDFDVKMKCVGSGAKFLSVGTVAAAFIATTLY